MAFGNEWEEEKKMAFENGEDAEKMLQLYIYNHMKKKNLNDVAEIFAQEANLEISQLARCNESLLMEWWELFWPTFCSRLSNKDGSNAQSFGQPSMVNALAMLVSLKNQGASSSRQTLMWNPQQDVLPVIPTIGSKSHLQLAATTMETPAQVTKDPKNDDLGRSDQMELTRPVGPNSAYTITEHHAGLSAAQALGNGPLGFPPVQLLSTRITPVPPPVNPSHLQMPVTIQPPPQVARAPRNDVSVERSVQVESTYPEGQGSTYPPAAPNAGEANWKNQLPLTGVRMGVPGPDLVSYKSRVLALFLQFMHQAVQMHGSGSNPPPDQSSEEAQEASDLENVPNSEDPNAVEEGNETEGGYYEFWDETL